MKAKSNLILNFFEKNYSVFFLCFCWLIGFSFGLHIFSFRSESFTWQFANSNHSLFQRILSFCGTLLPLVLSTFCIVRKRKIFLYIICFFRAISFGALLSAIGSQYGSASWLIQWLYFFTSTFVLLFTLWFWFRHINENDKTLIKDFCIVISAGIACFLFDYVFITKFLDRFIY